jgi:hypothetical protein
MGYYTAFNLHVNRPNHEEIIKDFRETCHGANVALTENGYTNSEISWWDCEDDLKAFSKKYPRVMFTMFGNGSDAGGDYWKLYVKNGKSYMTSGEITYPKYNAKMMKL